MSWDDNEQHEDEWVDEYGDGSLSATVICNHCGSEVYEDAIRCPICDQYVTASSEPRVKLHWRIVAAVLLGLSGLYLLRLLLKTLQG